MRRNLLLAGAALAAMGVGVSAQAQTAAPAPSRVALVVGESHYTAGALPTTLNDAGLIASSLTAAGFSVVGLPDLNANDLRKAMTDFVNRAGAAGPKGTAVLYFAGEAVQYAGETYLVPVDADIPTAVSVPLQAVKLSDYTRALSALPIKTRIVVVDGARPNGFARSGPPLAAGMAPVQADPGELIAYNDAPGTVAKDPPGATYSTYATALNAAMNQPGLPAGDVFSTVRLQVNTQTQGAQIPFDSNALKSPFSFFAPVAGAPQTALLAPQIAARRARPIRSFDANDAYQAAIERDTFSGYEDFLRYYPHSPMAPRVRDILAIRREALTWERIYRADTPNAYWTYLERYPHGPHAQDARRRLRYLEAALQPPPSFAPFVYDVPPPPQDEYVYIDRPVVEFDEPHFEAPPLPAIAFVAALATVFVMEPPRPPRDFDRHDLPVPQPMLSPFARRVAPPPPPPHPVFPTLQATRAQIGRLAPAAVAPAAVPLARLAQPPKPAALVTQQKLKPLVPIKPLVSNTPAVPIKPVVPSTPVMPGKPAPSLVKPAPGPTPPLAPHPATLPTTLPTPALRGVAPATPGRALVPAKPALPVAHPALPVVHPALPVVPLKPAPKLPVAPKPLVAPAPHPLVRPALPHPAVQVAPPRPIVHPVLPPRPAVRPAQPPHPVMRIAPPPHPVVRQAPPRPVVHLAPPPRPMVRPAPPRPVVHMVPPPRPIVRQAPPPRPGVHMPPPPRPIARPAPPRPAAACGHPGAPPCH